MRIVIGQVIDYVWMAAWLLVIPALLFVPASAWYELHSFVVTDSYTPEGDRIIEIDRSIRRNFYGEWRVEEQLRGVHGNYITVEQCKGSSYYRTDKSPPDVPTLGWYKGNDCDKEFPMIAGTYRVCVFITIKPEWFPQKHVESCSPDFRRS